MLDPGHVRAERVFDVRRTTTLPSPVALDANVLYFVHYPNLATLADVGGDTPAVYKTREYGALIKRALRARTQLTAPAHTLLEFAHIVERTEVEIAWRLAGHPGAFQHKEARGALLPQLANIRESVLAYLNVVRKDVAVDVSACDLPAILDAWQPSCGDVSDAVLVEQSLRAGVANLVSDDADVLTFRGIRVFTANQTALDLAQKAGRLGR